MIRLIRETGMCLLLSVSRLWSNYFVQVMHIGRMFIFASCIIADLDVQHCRGVSSRSTQSISIFCTVRCWLAPALLFPFKLLYVFFLRRFSGSFCTKLASKSWPLLLIFFQFSVHIKSTKKPTHVNFLLILLMNLWDMTKQWWSKFFGLNSLLSLTWLLQYLCFSVSYRILQSI